MVKNILSITILLAVAIITYKTHTMYKNQTLEQLREELGYNQYSAKKHTKNSIPSPQALEDLYGHSRPQRQQYHGFSNITYTCGNKCDFSTTNLQEFKKHQKEKHNRKI